MSLLKAVLAKVVVFVDSVIRSTAWPWPVRLRVDDTSEYPFMHTGRIERPFGLRGIPAFIIVLASQIEQRDRLHYPISRPASIHRLVARKDSSQ
jgi:hypothetical protein